MGSKERKVSKAVTSIGKNGRKPATRSRGDEKGGVRGPDNKEMGLHVVNEHARVVNKQVETENIEGIGTENAEEVETKNAEDVGTENNEEVKREVKKKKITADTTPMGFGAAWLVAGPELEVLR